MSRWWIFSIIAVISINAYEKIDFCDLEMQVGKEVAISGFVIDVEKEYYLVQNPMRKLCCQETGVPPIHLQIEIMDKCSYRRQEVKGVLERDESGFILR